MEECQQMNQVIADVGWPEIAPTYCEGMRAMRCGVPDS